MVSALLFGCTGLAVADSHEADGPSFNPVEGWTCNYNDGKGPADLDKTVAAWNEWMDDKGQGDYFAVTMTPNYFGERAFDVAWVGVWRDGNAMGRGADLWINEGGEIADGFSEVLTCDSHANFASQNVKQPAQNDEDPDDDTFVVTFSNCSIREGRTIDEYMAAQEEWKAYADEHGFTGGTWIWWPVYGESDNDYDFKIVSSADDHAAMGANWQLFSEGHYAKSNELFDDIVNCDIGRVYDGRTVREMADDD
jgi:hypothetical protein